MSHDWIKTLTEKKIKNQYKTIKKEREWRRKFEKQKHLKIPITKKLFLFPLVRAFNFTFCKQQERNVYVQELKVFKLRLRYLSFMITFKAAEFSPHKTFCALMFGSHKFSWILLCDNERKFWNWMEKKSNRHVFMGASLKMNGLTTYSILIFQFTYYDVIRWEKGNRKSNSKEHYLHRKFLILSWRHSWNF